MTLVYIFIGGGLGACFRWGITKWAGLAFPSFPFGVLLCNLLGSFLIGLLAGLWHKPSPVQIGLIVGVLGGFTTFSSFSLDTFKLLQGGQIGLAFSNALSSVILGIIFVWLGFLVSQLLQQT